MSFNPQLTTVQIVRTVTQSSTLLDFATLNIVLNNSKQQHIIQLETIFNLHMVLKSRIITRNVQSGKTLQDKCHNTTHI